MTLEEQLERMRRDWDRRARENARHFVNTRRVDYQRTTGEWLRRLRLHEQTIRSKWGNKVFEDYDRYLDTCTRSFANHYGSLAQYELRRID